MAMNGGDIEALLREGFPDADIELVDTVGDGDHWKAVIASSAFAGKSRSSMFSSSISGARRRGSAANGALEARPVVLRRVVRVAPGIRVELEDVAGLAR